MTGEFAQIAAREDVIRAVLSVLSAERPEREHAHVDDDRWFSDLQLVWAARRLVTASTDVEAEPTPVRGNPQADEDPPEPLPVLDHSHETNAGGACKDPACGYLTDLHGADPIGPPADDKPDGYGMTASDYIGLDQ